MARSKWWKDGIQFQCQGSGKCCVSRGEYGAVYLTPKDRRNLAIQFGLSTREFTKKYCEKHFGYWQLKGFTKKCVFLNGKECSVYEARPTQCRTWPFWPENMGPKAWSKEVKSFCPGVGQGRVWSEAEIKKQLRAQARNDKKL